MVLNKLGKNVNSKKIKMCENVIFCCVEDIKNRFFEEMGIDETVVKDLSEENKNSLIKLLNEKGFIENEYVILPKNTIFTVLNYDVNEYVTLKFKNLFFYMNTTFMSTEQKDVNEDIFKVEIV